MKALVLSLGLFGLLADALADDAPPRAGRLPAGCEVVMAPGMRITATTSAGKISITAVDELTRSYTWDGATRAIEMTPQKARFFGSLGLHHDSEGMHWRDHRGITGCITQEGQQHNKTLDEVMKWINDQKREGRVPYVYRDDGLMVEWSKNHSWRRLNVNVWQILIDGKKPKQLPGSQNEKIVVETVETETVPLVKAVASNDLKAVKALLAKSADPDARNSVEIPVLVMAIRRGSAPVVEALLSHGADPNVRDVDTDSIPLLEVFVNSPVRADIFRLLLAAGADVNAAIRKDVLNGFTPLMFAASAKHEDLVQLLLDQGANVNATTQSGDTALSIAKEPTLDMALRSVAKDPDAHKRLRLIRKLEAAGAKN